MLGSDAGSLVVSNGLIIIGVLAHFLLFLPRLAEISQSKSWNDRLWLLDDPVAMFWTSVGLTVATFVTLWRTALVDPGILPVREHCHWKCGMIPMKV